MGQSSVSVEPECSNLVVGSQSWMTGVEAARFGSGVLGNEPRELWIQRTERMTLSVTLDTNVLVELWWSRENSALTKALLALAEEGEIDLAVTTRINADIPSSPLADRISSLPQLGVEEIGSVFRLDYSGLDGGDMLGSDRFMDVTDSIDDELNRQGRKKRRPDWRDWDHLHGHFLKGRDVFLTWDRPFLEFADELRAKLGISIMNPQEFLAQLPASDIGKP